MSLSRMMAKYGYHETGQPNGDWQVSDDATITNKHEGGNFTPQDNTTYIDWLGYCHWLRSVQSLEQSDL